MKIHLFTLLIFTTLTSCNQSEILLENEYKVTVKAEEIPDRLKLLHSFDQQEHDALKDISFLSVNYEKDLENKNHHQATLDRICTFLDIPKAKSVVNLKRTSSSKIEDYIENHDEVKSVLFKVLVALNLLVVLSDILFNETYISLNTSEEFLPKKISFLSTLAIPS